ncbi:MAG: hypothetical protein AAFV77_01540 [Planctomycetota bacterium]
MAKSANTIRTNPNARAISLAALAALLVVLASADAAMRTPTSGVRESVDSRSHARAGTLGFGRLVEGLLACATVPEQDPVESVWPEPFTTIEPVAAQVASAPRAAFGLCMLTDLPPPALA